MKIQNSTNLFSTKNSHRIALKNHANEFRCDYNQTISRVIFKQHQFLENWLRYLEYQAIEVRIYISGISQTFCRRRHNNTKNVSLDSSCGIVLQPLIGISYDILGVKFSCVFNPSTVSSHFTVLFESSIGMEIPTHFAQLI